MRTLKALSTIVSKLLTVLQVVFYIAVACLLIFAGVAIFAFGWDEGRHNTLIALVIAAFLLAICALMFLLKEAWAIPKADRRVRKIPEPYGTGVMMSEGVYDEQENNHKTTMVLELKGGKRVFFERRNSSRRCQICGEEIPIVRDRGGSVLFDSAFHCLKEACREAWDNRNK